MHSVGLRPKKYLSSKPSIALPRREVGGWIILDVRDVAAALEDERLQPFLAELFSRPAAGDAGADDDRVEGSCGHEWVSTVEAALLSFSGGGRGRDGLYWPANRLFHKSMGARFGVPAG